MDKNRFSKEQFELYKKILKMPQPVLKHALKVFLDKFYERVIETPDYVYAEGETPITLLAHLDTVFSKPPVGIYYDREEGVIWSPQGCGHDDRAGVFMIMQIIAKGHRPHVIFTTDEEVGCVGASNMVKELPICPFKECKYIIQLDRRGVDDCVFYYDENEEFHKFVETFGFYTQLGSFTDIVTICPAWGIAGVNLSAGYFNEHTTVECLLLDLYMDTQRKVIKMLKAADESPEWKYIERTPPQVFSAIPGLTSSCEKCNEVVDLEDLYPVVAKDGTLKMFCVECMIDNVDWCVGCNKAFEVDKPLQSGKYYCPTCKGTKSLKEILKKEKINERKSSKKCG